MRFHSGYRLFFRSCSNCSIVTPSAPDAPQLPLTPAQLLGDVDRLALHLWLTHAAPPLRLTAYASLNDPAPWLPDPLRYAGGSQLLRASPPARHASVLCSSRIPPLGVLPLAADLPADIIGRAFIRSVREPGPGSCCLYAGHHLGSKRISPRLIPRQGSGLGFDVISRGFDTSTAENSRSSLIFPVH